MAETMNKPKLQLRNSFSINGNDKTPSPATKLLINHGKPNFTIQKTSKENGNTTTTSPLSPQLQNQNNNNNNDSNIANNMKNIINNNNNDNTVVNNNNNINYNPYKAVSPATPNTKDLLVKSTKFNGVFNAANVTVTPLNQSFQDSEDNEAAKVVLRKVAKSPEPELRDNEDENVPEFIRRQRRIQERLAKENLDFESRRSGYFTHVMISPTSTNRTSFMETMASPAVVPSLEMQPQQQAPATGQNEDIKEEVAVEEAQAETEAEVELKPEPEAEPEPEAATVAVAAAEVEPEAEAEIEAEEHNFEAVEHAAAAEQEVILQPQPMARTNGHINTADDEEEVAKAIEEVNKAVAGEDDSSPAETNGEEETNEYIETTEHATYHSQTDTMEKSVEQTNVAESHENMHVEAQVEITAEADVVKAEVAVATMECHEMNGDVEAVEADEQPKENGHAEENTIESNGQPEVTILHTNGIHDGPRIPSPDPSGALGVNFEPKTVVSFSKDLGANINKYPDTVVVVRDGDGVATTIDPALQEMAKLKFDIKADDLDVQVSPVLRAE